MTARAGTAAVALLLAASACTPAPAPEVLAPQERQVLQRGRDGGAVVPVRARADVDRLQAALAPAGGGRGPWLELTPGPDGLWTGHLEAPAGGWHALWLRADGRDPARPAVARFGVGEVFLVAGQSNSTNSGDTPMPALNGMVVSFDGTAWRTAADPMPGAQDRSAGGSPWPVFGDMVQRALGVPVALSVVGHGNTSILDWQPDSPPVSGHLQGRRLYPALRDRLAALGRVRAILWHQGESDAARGTTTAGYVAAFRRLAGALASDTGAEPVWVVARASYLPGVAMAARHAVRAAQEELWAAGDALPGPSTDELQGRLRWDGVHFSAAGLRVHGELWYAAVMTGLFPDGLPAAP